MHSDFNTSNAMTVDRCCSGDPRLDRFYNNTTPDAVTPLMTQGGLTRPACRDRRAFIRQGPLAKRLPPQMSIAGNDCLKRSIEMI